MLTPVDIDNIRFRGALLGYDKREVEQFLVQVSRAMEEYITRERESQQRLAEALREIGRYRENEDLIKNSMLLAQRTADDLIAAAKQKAAAAELSAEVEIQVMQQQLARLRGDREQFEYAFHGLLSGFIRQLESGNPGLAGKPVSGVQELPALAAVQEFAVEGHVAEPAQVEASPAPLLSVIQPEPVVETVDVPAVPAAPERSEADKDPDADQFYAALAMARPSTPPAAGD